MATQRRWRPADRNRASRTHGLNSGSTHRRRLAFQWLEDRRLLALVTVDANSDIVDFGGSQQISDLPGGDGDISLREAIIATNNTPGTDRIEFDTLGHFADHQSIDLTAGELSITDSLQIDGSGRQQLVVDGEWNSRVLNVDDGNPSSLIDVGLSGLTIYGGRTTGTLEHGGGIRNLENLTIEAARVGGNATVGDNSLGGGIFTTFGQLTLTGCEIYSNQTWGNNAHGGGIANVNGNLTVTDSTVDHNVTDGLAANGGGIFSNTDLTSQQTIILRSTISTNSLTGTLSGRHGAGIYNQDGRTVLQNSTITENLGGPSSVGGVASFGDNDTQTRVLSSIIAGNYGVDVEYVTGTENSFVSLDYNLVGIGNALGEFGVLDQTGVADPGLGALTYNGGPTQTHAALPGSPALDQGNNPLGLATDQRGAPFARSYGLGVDVGAVERQTVPDLTLLVDSVTDEDDGDYGSGDFSLREAINLANGSVGPDVIGFDLAGVFAQPQTISLTNGELFIFDSLLIEGPGADMLSIDGQRMFRGFLIDDDDSLTNIDVHLDGLTIQEGRAFQGYGGGIYSSENLTLSRSVIVDSRADQGGGIHNEQGNLTVIDSTITGNTLSVSTSIDSNGGGISNYSGNLEITNSTIAENQSLDEGGGVWSSGGNLSITGSTIFGNQSASGGGIHARTNLTGLQTTIASSTISGNTGSWGAGIYNFAGRMRIENSTVTENNVGISYGGAVGSTGSSYTRTEVFSSIVSGNVGGDDISYLGLAATNPFYSYGWNLIGNGNATSRFSPVTYDQVGVTDPGLGILVDNGGMTKTHAVLAGSPALNLGQLPPGAIADQRGLPFVRNDGAGVDVGAVERQTVTGLPFPLIVDTLTDVSDGNYDPGQLSLREAVGLANGSVGADSIAFDTGGVFADPQTIDLLHGQLDVVDAALVEGPGAGRLTVDASGRSRVFNISDENYAGTFPVGLNDLTIAGGTTTDLDQVGGGIRNTEDLQLLRSVISGNVTQGDFARGGGIANVRGSLQLTDSTVSDNRTQGQFASGGGIANYEGYLSVNSSSITGNSLADANSDGGGIWSVTSLVGPQTLITNSTISGNVADRYGGGVANAYGLTIIRNSTITYNASITAPYAHGVSSFSGSGTRTEVFSSIIADAAFAGGDVNFVPDTGVNTFQSQGYNLIGQGNALGAFDNNDLTNVTDAKLAPLGDNGGPTETHRLLVGSPAIGNGRDLFGLPNDQRGAPFSRDDGTGVDVGAVEYQQIDDFPLIVNTLVDESDGEYGEDDLSLREAVGLANGSVGPDVISFDVEGVFASPQTMGLHLGALTITDEGFLVGPGADGVAIDALQKSQVIRVDDESNDQTFDFTLSGVTITGGFAVSGPSRGGGIENHENLTIETSVITGNSTFGSIGGGGGIYNTGTLAILETHVTHNFNLDDFSDGGGILNLGGDLSLVRSTVSENHTEAESSVGGGISTVEGNLTIIDSTISGNRTFGEFAHGGGIATDTDLTAKETLIINSTISGNATYGADSYGGAVANLDGFATIEHSTITENTAHAGTGGGVIGYLLYSNDARTAVRSSIIAGNAVSDVDFIGVSGTNSFQSLGFNLIGEGNAVGLFMNDDLRTMDPQLGPLMHNGGPTQTHVPMATSPAIDSGDPAFESPPIFDQRGDPYWRVQNSRIDIGAVELQSTSGLACDFDGDEDCDIDDLDLFYLELGGNDPMFNLDGMGVVDNEDLTEWLDLASLVDPLGRTFIRGDADLSGSVGGNDFTALAANFGGPGGWSQGNFVVDAVLGGGDVGGADFTQLAANFGFASPLHSPWSGSEGANRSDGIRQTMEWQAPRSAFVEVVGHAPIRPAAHPMFRLYAMPRAMDELGHGREAQIVDQVFRDWPLTS